MQQLLNRVAENLYRSESSSRYYAIFFRDGKQIKRSLKTTDPAIAKRRLRNLSQKVDSLDLSKSQATFGQVIERWQQTALAVRDLKPATKVDIKIRLRRILEFWDGLTTKRVVEIVPSDVEIWFAKRKPTISAQRMNNELGLLKEILAFAKRDGYLLENPAESIRWLKVTKTQVTPPTHHQFTCLVNQLRSTHNGNAADFVELLGYSGMREAEAANLTWAEVDFKGETFRVSGGELGTKNRQTRTIPLFPPMRELLLRIQQERVNPKPTDTVMKIQQCWVTMKVACQTAKLPHFHHHDMRHFFCSNAIEHGIDYMTIAQWLGHQDGGQLVAETYGHLRKDHSHDMARKMTFSAVPTAEKIIPFPQSA